MLKRKIIHTLLMHSKSTYINKAIKSKFADHLIIKANNLHTIVSCCFKTYHLLNRGSGQTPSVENRGRIMFHGGCVLISQSPPPPPPPPPPKKKKKKKKPTSLPMEQDAHRYLSTILAWVYMNGKIIQFIVRHYCRMPNPVFSKTVRGHRFPCEVCNCRQYSK